METEDDNTGLVTASKNMIWRESVYDGWKVRDKAVPPYAANSVFFRSASLPTCTMEQLTSILARVSNMRFPVH